MSVEFMLAGDAGNTATGSTICVNGLETVYTAADLTVDMERGGFRNHVDFDWVHVPGGSFPGRNCGFGFVNFTSNAGARLFSAMVAGCKLLRDGGQVGTDEAFLGEALSRTRLRQVQLTSAARCQRARVCDQERFSRHREAHTGASLGRRSGR